ncbi:MAG TPA: pyridoxamine 5'-phosphate oxidase family protein [Polyangiales bacterium]|nr:pyridoxamine 5'-phosphate oxidase family protein [Polyangiales bacterium]
MDSPFHQGEQSVQTRAGVRERAEQMGRRMIRAFLPEQHRQFFEQLPFVLVGSVDDEGAVWASVLSGRPGFVYTPDEHTLRVRAAVGAELGISAGRALGILGIELPTRRRNRVNGRVTSADAHGLTLAVDQSFGNCPQYITVRVPRAVPRELGTVRGVGARLPEELVAWIRASDTAFIASAASADPSGEANEGVDVSHRGGEPGFVEVSERDGTTVLTIPDYAGNNAFNTLGNLQRYPHVGLSFPSFERGDWLALSGRAELVWDADEVARYPHAKRLVRMTVEQGRVLPGGFPFAS